VKRNIGRRAFTLWELIVVIAMMGVAGLLTARLFTASMHAIQSVPQVQEQQVKVDRMLAVLRQDVWGAERMQVNGNSISLTQAGRTIQWKFDKRSASRSVEGAAAQEQWTLPFGLQAKQDGPSLVLQTPDAGETRRFISQMLTVAEAK
jgi:prepilin-type N-terminal cleavage/methylation domain-containing protein